MIYRATTPILKFEFINDEFSLYDFNEIELVIAQNDNELLIKNASDLTIIDKNHCEIKLTQKEINLFQPQFKLQIQFRLKDNFNNVIASDIMEKTVREALREEEL